MPIRVESIGRWFKARGDDPFSGSGSGVDSDNAASFLQSNPDIGILPRGRAANNAIFSFWSLLDVVKRLYWTLFDEKRTYCRTITTSGTSVLFPNSGNTTPSTSTVIHSLRVQSESATPVTVVLTLGDSFRCEPLRFRLAGDGTGFSEQFRLGSEPMFASSLDMTVNLSVAAPVTITWCQSRRHDNPTYADSLTSY